MFYGWWIVGAVVGVQLLLSGLLVQAYGTYAAAWRDTFGWSSTVIAAAYGVHRVQRGLLAPAQGFVIQRFGARRTMRLGMVLFGVGLVALSRVDGLGWFFLAFVVASLGTSLTGVLSLSTVLVNWFERRRSTALALMSMGKSLGGLAVPGVAWAIAAFGWRAALLGSGVLVLTGGLLLTQGMRSTPEEMGLAPDGDAPRSRRGTSSADSRAAEDGDDRVHDPADAREPTGSDLRTANGAEDGSDGAGEPRVAFSTREALRTRAFWLLSTGHALAVAVVSAVIVHLVLYLSDSGQFSLQTAAGFYALMTGFSIAGQGIGGPLGDSAPKHRVAGFAALGHAAGALLLALTQSVAGVVAFAILHGLAWGIRAPQMAALRADWFGREKYATIMGFSSTIVMLGSILGPVVVGVAADAGSYAWGFGVVAVCAVASSACFLLANDPQVR